MEYSDSLHILAMIGELRGIMQNQHGLVSDGGEPFSGCLKMPGQYVFFADPIIGKEPVSRLRVRPILTDQGNALSYSLRQLPEKLSKSLTQAHIPKLTSCQFLIDPLAPIAYSGKAD